MYRSWVLTSCAAIALSMLAASVNAFGSLGTTYLTFNSPVAIPGATLRPGTYIFERVPTGSRAEVVRVMSRDRSRVYLTQITVPVERPVSASADTTVTFKEAVEGAAPAVSEWYPAGDTLGQQFIYPRQ